MTEKRKEELSEKMRALATARPWDRGDRLRKLADEYDAAAAAYWGSPNEETKRKMDFVWQQAWPEYSCASWRAHREAQGKAAGT